MRDTEVRGLTNYFPKQIFLGQGVFTALVFYQ